MASNLFFYFHERGGGCCGADNDFGKRKFGLRGLPLTQEEVQVEQDSFD